MKKLRIILLICSFALVCNPRMPTLTARAEAWPPDEMGPYPAGYIHLDLTDPSRHEYYDGYAKFRKARPIAVDIWYPADPTNGGRPFQPAQYVLDPYNVYWGLNQLGWDTMSSTIWEKYGLAPAYQEPIPSSNGSFPLVMLSHGWGNTGWMHITNGTWLASHGIVVAAVTNYGDMADIREYAGPITLLSRAKDIPFVLDELLERNQKPGNLFYGLINPEQIAMIGHSWGGLATLALTGGDENAYDMLLEPAGPDDPIVPIPIEPRIKAIITQDASSAELYFREIANIRIPALTLAPDWTYAWAWQARAHAGIQGQPNYRVDIRFAHHNSFHNFCQGIEVLYHEAGALPLEVYEEARCPESQEIIEENQRLTNMYMTMFLKKVLEGETAYNDYLTPGYAIANEPYIEFFITEQRNPQALDGIAPWEFIYFPHQPGSKQFVELKDPQVDHWDAREPLARVR